MKNTKKEQLEDLFESIESHRGDLSNTLECAERHFSDIQDCLQKLREILKIE